MTAYILGAVLALLVGYDVWAYVTGRADTITAVVRRASAIVPFLAGVLAGHFWFCGVLAFALVLGGCAHAVNPAVTVAPPAEPAGGSLHFIGRFMTAQGLRSRGGPRADLRARRWTQGHSIETLLSIRPFWSDDSGGEGIAVPLATVAVVDLAVVSGTFPHFYPLADVPPKPGARVHFTGYDWSNRGRAYAPRRIDAKVVRLVAGHVILDRSGEPGSSGSCVLDDQDRVLAINCHGHAVRSGEEVGRAVGTWGSWVRSALAEVR